MKISPVATSASSVGSVEGGAVAPRTLRMAVNATPGREIAQAAQVEALPEAAVTIPDPNDASATTEATEPLSPQFAALAKQRRALQQERQAFEREKATASQTATQADAIPLARLKEDALGVLLDAGVTYDQLTEQILARRDGITPEIQALKAELKATKEDFSKQLTDRDQQARTQVLAEISRDAKRLVAEGDDYEMVREHKAVPKVTQYIESWYDKTGEVLDVREALQDIEEELLEDSLRLARIKKVQSKLAPPEPVAPAAPQQRQVRTLTNRDTASVPLSAKARALAAFNGTLKK